MKNILIFLFLFSFSSVWSQAETDEFIAGGDASISKDSNLNFILPFVQYELEKNIDENELRIEFEGEAGLTFDKKFNITLPLMLNPRLKTPVSDIIDGELNIEIETENFDSFETLIMLGAEYKNILGNIKAISDWAEFQQGIEVDTYISSDLENRIAWNFDIEYSYYNGLYFFMLQPKARYTKPIETDSNSEFFLSINFVKDLTKKLNASFFYDLDTGKSSSVSTRRFELLYLASDQYEYITYINLLEDEFEVGLRLEYIVFD
jgi:hypothetical protein